jgi:hypothetical protein
MSIWRQIFYALWLIVFIASLVTLIRVLFCQRAIRRTMKEIEIENAPPPGPPPGPFAHYPRCASCGKLDCEHIAPIFIRLIDKNELCDCANAETKPADLQNSLNDHIAKYGIPKELT